MMQARHACRTEFSCDRRNLTFLFDERLGRPAAFVPTRHDQPVNLVAGCSVGEHGAAAAECLVVRVYGDDEHVHGARVKR